MVSSSLSTGRYCTFRTPRFALDSMAALCRHLPYSVLSLPLSGVSQSLPSLTLLPHWGHFKQSSSFPGPPNRIQHVFVPLHSPIGTEVCLMYLLGRISILHFGQVVGSILEQAIFILVPQVHPQPNVDMIPPRQRTSIVFPSG